MSTTLTIDTPDEQEALRGCLYGFAKRLPDEPIVITDPALTLQAARDMGTYARLCKAHADRSITPHLVPDVLEGLQAALDDVAANYAAANRSGGAIGAIDAANWKADRRRLVALREKVHAFANSAPSSLPEAPDLRTDVLGHEGHSVRYLGTPCGQHRIWCYDCASDLLPWTQRLEVPDA